MLRKVKAVNLNSYLKNVRYRHARTYDIYFVSNLYLYLLYNKTRGTSALGN